MRVPKPLVILAASILFLNLASCSKGVRFGGGVTVVRGPGWYGYYGAGPWRSCCWPRPPVVVPPDVIDPDDRNPQPELPIEPSPEPEPEPYIEPAPDFPDFGGDFGGFGGDFGGGDFGGFDFE